MSSSPNSPPIGLHLTEPNNLFRLQNDVTQNLNHFEEKKNRYLQCNNNDSSASVVPSCSDKDSFSEVTIAYENLYESLNTLENAMNSERQKNPNAVSKKQFRENAELIHTTHEKIQDMRKSLDDQLKTLEKGWENGNQPSLDLRSTQFIYMLSVIAIFCLIYYIIVM